MIQGGHLPVLVGYSTPEQWAYQELRRFLGPITFIALVCSDDELDRRLRDRTWMGSPRERESLADLNRMFRTRGDITVIDTDDQPPDALADRILELIQREPLVARTPQ